MAVTRIKLKNLKIIADDLGFVFSTFFVSSLQTDFEKIFEKINVRSCSY